jgi:hypothetical protein
MYYNNKLPAGYKKYLNIAYNITFTEKELEVLKNIMDTVIISDYSGEEDFDMCFSIGGAIHECSTQGYCYETYNVDETDGDGMISDTRSVPLTFMQYLLVNFKRVFLFIALVPLSRVPLYLNDPVLSLFARWRLTIAK